MDNTPTYRDLVLFQLKASIFRLQRHIEQLRQPVAKHALGDCNGVGERQADRLLAESVSDLWDHSAAAAEQVLQAGKIQNLRIATLALDGCTVPAGEVFSFWRQIGRPTQGKGYVQGRELRQGCIIPTVGGGLCQLSNALYDAALKAGFTIHERHPHTQVIAGSLAEQGRDATVFWNYVDLRLSAAQTFSIRAILTPAQLIVQFWGT